MAQNNFVAKSADISSLPVIAQEKGIDAVLWDTLNTSIFPGASENSIVAAVQYCKARGLDILKKPVHIVPMLVKNNEGKEEWRDTIMPSIGELRTTATRSKLYMGLSEPRLGEQIKVFINGSNGASINVPEWIELTAYKFHELSGKSIEYTHREYFVEAVGKKKDGSINSMWCNRPIGQLTKCCEAGVLRKAFPEEIGDQYSVEEMQGKQVDNQPIDTSKDTHRSDINNIVEGEIIEEESINGITYEEIKSHMEKAESIDDLNVAMDLIKELPDEEKDNKRELTKLSLELIKKFK